MIMAENKIITFFRKHIRMDLAKDVAVLGLLSGLGYCLVLYAVNSAVKDLTLGNYPGFNIFVFFYCCCHFPLVYKIDHV